MRITYRPTATPGLDAPRVAAVRDESGEQLARAGAGVHRAGVGMWQVGDVLAERVDKSRATEADAKLADAFREALTGTGGYLHAQGRAAIDGRAATVERLDEAFRTIDGTLTPAQREMFAASAEARRQRAREEIDTHYARSVQVDAIAETETRAGRLREDAVDAYFAPQDPQGPAVGPPVAPAVDRFPEVHRAALREADELARLQGAGPERAEAMRRAQADAIHAGIIERLIDSGRPEEAAGYMRGADIGPLLREKLGGVVEKARVRARGMAVALEVANRADLAGLPAQVRELEARLTAGTLTLDEHEEAVAYVSKRDGMLAAERAAARTSAWDRAELAVRTNPHLPIPRELQRAIDATGQTDAFSLWQAKHEPTSDEYGREAMMLWRPADVQQRFATEAELIDAMRPHLSRADLADLVKRWRTDSVDPRAQPDAALLIADSWRALAKLPPQYKIDPVVLAQWTELVHDKAREFLRSNPGMTYDDALPPAIEAAKRVGWYTDASTKPDSFVSALTGSPSGNVFVKLGDGTTIEGQLTSVVPGSEMTYRDAVIAELTQQGSQETVTDGRRKPAGYVSIVDYTRKGFPAVTLPLREVTEQQILAAAFVRMREDNAATVATNTSRKAELMQTAREAFGAVLRRELQPGVLPSVAQRRAVDRFLEEQATRFRGLGLTTHEMLDAAGMNEVERQSRFGVPSSATGGATGAYGIPGGRR